MKIRNIDNIFRIVAFALITMLIEYVPIILRLPGGTQFSFIWVGFWIILSLIAFLNRKKFMPTMLPVIYGLVSGTLLFILIFLSAFAFYVTHAVC
jgi:hypothetical protein